MNRISLKEFDEVYHSIDAPTIMDQEIFNSTKKRILKSCDSSNKEDFRLEEVFYLKDNIWIGSRKCDGTNCRVLFDGNEVFYNGKTNKANFSNDQKEYIEETFKEEIFEEYFRKEGKSPRVVIFGELVGPKIQNGDNHSFKELEFIVFDVLINNVFLDVENIKQIAKYFNLRSSYDLLTIKGNLYQLQEIVKDKDFKYEGLVVKPLVELYTKNKNRLILKIKKRDYGN